MLTFLNFNARQLASTDGFNRKIKKVAEKLGIKKILYSEIINIEDNSLDVLLIDEKMYFHKIHLYSILVVKMLNDEFSKILNSLGFTNLENSLDDSNCVENCNLLEEISSTLSRSIELLNIESSSNIDRLENSVSSQFNICFENFTYKEIHSAVEPLVKDFIHHLHSFKIISLTKVSIEVLAITSECKLFQYTIPVSSSYTKFLNRYLSAILPYDSFVEMKRNLRTLDFSTSLKETLPIYKSKKEKLDTCGFLTFLLNTYKRDIKGEGSSDEGLKNFHKFFFDTCSNEKEAKNSIMACYMKAKTYEQKNK